MNLNTKSRILVVDGHPLLCKAVAQLINRQSDMMCCGTVTSYSGTLPAVTEHRPDLVLLDLNIKDGDGLDLIETLLKRFHRLQVIVLSQYDDESLAERSFKAGARGYVTKWETSKEILNAIQTVLAGEIYMDQKTTVALQYGVMPAKPPTVNGMDARLTRREIQVLQLLGAGMKTRHVAGKLNLSIKTIETYREHLKRKLSLKNSTELTHFAICWMEQQSPS